MAAYPFWGYYTAPTVTCQYSIWIIREGLLLCHVEVFGSVELIYKALTLPSYILEPLA